MKCKNVYQENSNLKRTKGLIVIVVVVVMGNKTPQQYNHYTGINFKLNFIEN